MEFGCAARLDNLSRPAMGQPDWNYLNLWNGLRLSASASDRPRHDKKQFTKGCQEEAGRLYEQIPKIHMILVSQLLFFRLDSH